MIMDRSKHNNGIENPAGSPDIFERKAEAAISEEQPEPSPEDLRITNEIAECNDWESLYNALRRNGDVLGEDMIDIIDLVRKGGSPRYITRKFDLRAKVLNLLELDKVRKDLSESGDQRQDSEGWYGDWALGERPEGFINSDEQYRYLREQGYRATEALGEDFVKRSNILLQKAKYEGLNKEELDEFLENNRQFLTSMDQYEARENQSKKKSFVKRFTGLFKREFNQAEYEAAVREAEIKEVAYREAGSLSDLESGVRQGVYDKMMRESERAWEKVRKMEELRDGKK
jgi:hypothetical protein